MKKALQGSMVAMVTPFTNGRVDEGKIRELVEFFIAAETDAIVPCGTTGESPTLSYEEHKRVVEITVAAVGRRIPVIAGTGSNSTTEALELTEHAYKAGANAALLTTPYYNKPTQKGLIEHFRTIAETVDLPLILYNIPGRTGVNMLPETVAALAEHPRIVGIKEASGNLEQMTSVIQLCGEKITVLSGDDTLTLPLMAVGGKGVISVVANIVPRAVADLTHAALRGEWERARTLHLSLFPLCQAMFYETNPIPVKTALALMGKISGELRLPLTAMSEANVARLTSVMRAQGLLG